MTFLYDDATNFGQPRFCIFLYIVGIIRITKAKHNSRKSQRTPNAAMEG